MFVYNDIFFGPRFRRDVLSRMNDSNPCTVFCSQLCGVDLSIPDSEILITDREEQDSNE